MSIFNFLSRAKASALPKTYILLGPPGSGKSTQAELLARHFQLVHIDIGRELRSAAEKDTQLGREINEIINQKTDLVPDSVVVRVLSHVLEQVPKEAGVLIDGAPRRFSQIQAVEEALRTFGPLYHARNFYCFAARGGYWPHCKALPVFRLWNAIFS
ncbi:MAG: nucleoside monophosphate kinase [Candidatus Moraniibacteriota bacterium]